MGIKITISAKNLLLYLVRLGAEKQKDDRRKRWLIITNVMALYLFTASVLYSVILHSQIDRIDFIALAILPFIYITVIALNKYGLFSCARALLFLTLNSAIFYFSQVFGRDSYAQSLLVFCAFLPALTCSIRERWLTTLGTLLPLSYFLLLIATDYQLIRKTSLSENIQYVAGFASILCIFAIVIITTVYFQFSTNKEESRLIEKNKELSALFSELEDAQSQVMESAHHAGMAEVATEILHNAGNVLNSINISAEMIRLKATSRSLHQFPLNIEKLQSHKGNFLNYLQQDDRAEKLLGYLENFSKNLQEAVNNIQSESKSMLKNVDHVKNVISRQQRYSKSINMNETIYVRELIDDAIQLGGERFEQRGISVQVNVPEDLAIFSDRHKLLQVIVNLISNARHALADIDQIENDRLIKIEASIHGPEFRFRVKDNGIGITEENKDKIFQYGFTTKVNGHGYGLHNSVLTVKGMGGDITFKSKGRNQGAEFIVTLPHLIDEKSVHTKQQQEEEQAA